MGSLNSHLSGLLSSHGEDTREDFHVVTFPSYSVPGCPRKAKKTFQHHFGGPPLFFRLSHGNRIVLLNL